MLSREGVYRVVGGRANTEQRVALGAREDGRLAAVIHTGTAAMTAHNTMPEAFIAPARCLYRADSFRLEVQVADLDMLANTSMRAPGEAPGSFALESALDELADRLGMDPIELRLRNEPERDPTDGRPFSSRNVVRAFRDGAERFGWDRRGLPGARREGRWLVGLGVASSTYPAYVMPGSVAQVEHTGDGVYAVRIGAADIGTGNRTVLTQVAADALRVPVDRVHVQIGDTALPMATVEGGSAGLASHGSAVVEAARRFREEHGSSPALGARTESSMAEYPEAGSYAAHSYGAQFVEVRVDADTGEIRVPRMTGVFSCGRIVNPRTARSQFMGGMVWGLSMALHEHSVVDHRFGHVVNHDLAEYHVPVCADIGEIDVSWLDEEDLRANALGAKGIGEIGITGTAAAIASAVYNATGIRVRDYPITLDKHLARLPAPV